MTAVSYVPHLHEEARKNERASQVALVLKNPPANAGDIRDAGLIPGLGRSPRERHGNTLQYSCLENSMDRGTWQATYSPWGCTESDTTEATYHTCHYYSQLLYYCGLFIFSFFALHLFLVSFLVCFSLPSKSESFLYKLKPLFCRLLDVCREAT